ncbi:hypothetical protein BT93_L2881 [Corymbia citriodora subsp. variegata]|uniref:Uncharacterized protein n=1 Tax=Corymbia citriodora subsp. variegata TaxID=360336 RepID=A0A8T0CN84_CORYI|nr:hypothetical protein BT93_L2881 [Corymbia citriodora subsp. variegata]
MAGRYIEDDGCFIDCNDLGVELVHATVNGQIDQLLHGDPNMDLIDQLSKFPTNVVGNPLVVIQVNTFECGGLVIGLRFTRKIGDVCTMAMFVNSWATACRRSIDSVVCPSFELSTLHPAKESVAPYRPPPRIDNGQFVMSRFRFSSNAILKLKALARGDKKDLMANNSQPSRVEVVSSLISRALIDIDRNKHGKQMAFVVCMMVNLREKTNLAIPANSFGNLSAVMFARSGQPTADKSKLEFNGMVNVICDMISNAKTKYATIEDKEELCSMVVNSQTEFIKKVSTEEEFVIAFSSWCRYGLYENDFGWGKPVFISNTSVNFRLIMELLKQDQEFVAFTS